MTHNVVLVLVLGRQVGCRSDGGCAYVIVLHPQLPWIHCNTGNKCVPYVLAIYYIYVTVYVSVIQQNPSIRAPLKSARTSPLLNVINLNKTWLVLIA